MAVPNTAISDARAVPSSELPCGELNRCKLKLCCSAWQAEKSRTSIYLHSMGAIMNLSVYR